MYTVLIVIHALVTFSLIGIILMQRSSSDGMGLSGSSSTSFMSGRAAASFITRATAVLAATFIILSLVIGIVTAHDHASRTGSIMDRMENKPGTNASESQKTVPAPEKKEQPAVPRPE